MRQIMVAAICAALTAVPLTQARAQDLQDTIGRLLQGMQGGQDQRQDERGPPLRRGDERRSAYDGSDRRERMEMLDEADRRLDAQQRQIDEDRRRIESERRRLSR